VESSINLHPRQHFRAPPFTSEWQNRPSPPLGLHIQRERITCRGNPFETFYTTRNLGPYTRRWLLRVLVSMARYFLASCEPPRPLLPQLSCEGDQQVSFLEHQRIIVFISLSVFEIIHMLRLTYLTSIQY
jgi:hypothetical protein